MVLGLFNQPYVYPAECIIKVNQIPLIDLYPLVTEVTVEATRDRFSEATITFSSPVDQTGRWQVADDPRLETWADITIEADFQVGREEILHGVILDVTPNYPANAGETTVTLTARDNSARLDREVRQRVWGIEPVGTADALILLELAATAGLVVDPTSGPGQIGFVAAQNSSDIVFLMQRALMNGYELIFSSKTVYFGPMRINLASQPTIMVYAGQQTNCRSFSAPTDGHRRRTIAYAKRDAHGDPGGIATVTSDLPQMGLMAGQGRGIALRDHIGFLDRESVPDDAQSEGLARSLANLGDMNVRAEGELDGSLYGHVLRVGEPVEVDGVGERYSGTFYVDTVTHRFDMTGYSQRFSLMRNALGRLPGGGLGGALAAVL
jgi:hypothetical protein